MKLSIIMPVLNEEVEIAKAIERALALPGVHELIVVDGGSDDRTVELARERDVLVIEGPRGRGPQQNAGAKEASGDTLLFLHADVALPNRAIAVITESLARPGVVAGAFRVQHQPKKWRSSWKRWVLKVADLRSRYSRLPYGDQAIFLRKDQFDAIGGFPQEPLMEDLALSRALSRRGRIVVADAIVRVSGRRFEAQTLLQCLWVNTFPSLYALGVPPELLARLYGNPR